MIPFLLLDDHKKITKRLIPWTQECFGHLVAIKPEYIKKSWKLQDIVENSIMTEIGCHKTMKEGHLLDLYFGSPRAKV